MPNVESLAAIWRPTQSTQISNSSVSHHQLETAYKAMLHLSVAFKFFALDWIEFGHSCVSQQADMLLHAEFNKYVFILFTSSNKSRNRSKNCEECFQHFVIHENLNHYFERDIL